MINSYKSIKLQTRTYKKLMQIKKLYGFKALSDTIQMLIGNCEVKKLLTEEDIKQLAKTNDLIEIDTNTQGGVHKGTTEQVDDWIALPLEKEIK